jgi:cell fate regulator YaaT (PSP1 superfamily)
MAKDQGLSLNPTKISGACGRLMCCLSYEQQAYEEKIKRVPKVGSLVSTPLGEGTVVSANILKEKIQVKLTGQNDTVNLEEFEAKDVKIVKASNNSSNEVSKEEFEELKNLED